MSTIATIHVTPRRKTTWGLGFFELKRERHIERIVELLEPKVAWGAKDSRGLVFNVKYSHKVRFLVLKFCLKAKVVAAH